MQVDADSADAARSVVEERFKETVSESRHGTICE